MKKVLGITLIALFALSFTACKKDYDCVCVGVSGDYEKVGKGKNAADACNDAEDKFLGIPLEDCSPKI